MRKYKVGLIRVLTTSDPELLTLHGKLLEEYHDNRAIDEKHILLWEQIVRIV